MPGLPPEAPETPVLNFSKFFLSFNFNETSRHVLFSSGHIVSTSSSFVPLPFSFYRIGELQITAGSDILMLDQIAEFLSHASFRVLSPHALPDGEAKL